MLVLFGEFDNGIGGDLVRRVWPALHPHAEAASGRASAVRARNSSSHSVLEGMPGPASDCEHV
jgi:hypothetical protein